MWINRLSWFLSKNKSHLEQKSKLDWTELDGLDKPSFAMNYAQNNAQKIERPTKQSKLKLHLAANELLLG